MIINSNTYHYRNYRLSLVETFKLECQQINEDGTLLAKEATINAFNIAISKLVLFIRLEGSTYFLNDNGISKAGYTQGTRNVFADTCAQINANKKLIMQK